MQCDYDAMRAGRVDGRGGLMRIEALREFVVFAKCQNFSAAARELHLSQPVMSTHIMNMEKELGFVLVDRKRGATLTEAGQEFLIGAQATLSAYERTVKACRGLAKGHPPVRIRTTGRMPFLERALSRVHDVPFEMVELPVDSTAPLEELEGSGAVDVCNCYDFGFDPVMSRRASDRGIRLIKMCEASLCIAMMSENPLARRSDLRREDLHGATVLVTSSKWFDFLKVQIGHVLERDGSLGLEYWMNPIGSPLAYRFIDLGGAVCLFDRECDDCASFFFERDDVVVRETLDGEPILLDQMAAYREDNPNPNVHALVEALEEICPL